MAQKPTQILQTIECPLPGFEGVTVTFDLMATQHQIDAFVKQAGLNKSHEGVIAKIEGWPPEFGLDPWDGKVVPGVWLAWVARKGYGMAMKAYLDDPNSLTA